MNTNLQDYVAIYNINDLSLCKKIVSKIETGGWQKHTYHDPISNKFNSYEDDLDISYQDEDTRKAVEFFIGKAVSEYLQNAPPISFQLQELADVRFNKYNVGTNMKFHHDHIHTLFDGEKKGVPILTVLGLLNDDFEGGDFLMFDCKKVNLSVGDIIVFPSNFLYPHAVTTVTKGTRYSFVSWGY
jgi:predicted 2-oxoglutarate/Fe(II)-dependent dioxygenase YbiX